jgi:hypothetical protein
MAMPDDGRWWRGTGALAAAAVLVWMLLGVALPLAASRYARETVLGYGLDAFLALVAIPVVLGFLLFAVDRRQAGLDRRRGGES